MQLNQSTTEVSDAKLADLPQIANWYAHEWADAQADERILKSLKERLQSKKIYAMKVVRVGEELVGVACLQEKDMGEAHPELTPWLAGVYVKNEYRHKGIGLLLSKAIVQEVRNQNFPVCYLFSDKMEAWYHEQGWETIGHENYKNLQVAVMKFEVR